MKSTSEKLRERVRRWEEEAPPPGEEVSKGLRGLESERSEPAVPDAGDEVSLEEGEGDGEEGLEVLEVGCVQSDIWEIRRWNIGRPWSLL